MKQLLAFNLPANVKQWAHTLAVAVIGAVAAEVVKGGGTLHWHSMALAASLAVAGFLKKFPLPE